MVGSRALAACVVLAGHVPGGWRVYTVATAVAGFVLTAWTAAAHQKDSSSTGLVQRGLIAVYWTWIVTLSMHLATSPVPR